MQEILFCKDFCHKKNLHRTLDLHVFIHAVFSLCVKLKIEEIEERTILYKKHGFFLSHILNWSLTVYYNKFYENSQNVTFRFNKINKFFQKLCLAKFKANIFWKIMIGKNFK